MKEQTLTMIDLCLRTGDDDAASALSTGSRLCFSSWRAAFFLLFASAALAICLLCLLLLLVVVDAEMGVDSK